MFKQLSLPTMTDHFRKAIAFSEFTDAEREAVRRAHPASRPLHGRDQPRLYDAIYGKPETTFGNVEADVLADKEPSVRPENFCHVIRASAWPS